MFHKIVIVDNAVVCMSINCTFKDLRIYNVLRNLSKLKKDYIRGFRMTKYFTFPTDHIGNYVEVSDDVLTFTISNGDYFVYHKNH